MYLEKLQLTNFRNYENLELEFSKNVNVFVGKNNNTGGIFYGT